MFSTASVPLYVIYNFVFLNYCFNSYKLISQKIEIIFFLEEGKRGRSGFANIYAVRRKILCLWKRTATVEFGTTLTILGFHNSTSF